MPELTWVQAAAWRSRRHYLDKRAASGSMLAVASRLCGLHAQVLSSSAFTLWARVEGLKRDDVSRALWQDRTLLKTWAMRGTLHLLPASELPMWYAALSTSRRYTTVGLLRRFGLTVKDLERLTEAVGEALKDGTPVTREELAKKVRQLTGSKKFAEKISFSWGTIMKPAAFRGRLCFGASVGQRVRFTHPGAWISRAEPAESLEDVMPEIVRRYLAAYGPATDYDVHRWWGGAGMAEVRRWIAALGDEVTRVQLGGVAAWMLTSDVKKAKQSAPSRMVNLLPAFDQYVIGASRHADKLLPGSLRARIYRPQGWISAVLLVNGFMQGVWRHELKRSRVEVRIEPFVALPAWVRRKAEEEAERLAAFLGGSLALEWKPAA